MTTISLTVPNVLGKNTEAIEEFYLLVGNPTPTNRYTFDMSGINFAKPYGVVALVIAARRLSILSNRPVYLENIPEQVHLYLNRMNLFQIGSDWLRPATTLNEEWSRSSQTPNLLELTLITGPSDVLNVAARAERIFSRWLMVPDLNSLINVISELCSNIYQHSGDSYGCVLIQKYGMPTRDQVVVNLAVGDLGCGIRGSLIKRHGEFGRVPLDYLRAAMSGQTARRTGRGGLGLRQVERIAASEGGYLWLRSETAAILSRGQDRTQEHQNIALVPGTQVAVEFCAPLRT